VNPCVACGAPDAVNGLCSACWRRRAEALDAIGEWLEAACAEECAEVAAMPLLVA
jgi:hypothetical protein